MNPTQNIDLLNVQWAKLSAMEILSKALELFGSKITFAASLGAEDQVITYMLSKIDKSANIITLDTGRVFPESYDLLHRTVSRYGIAIKSYYPDTTQVEEMVNTKGINLFYESIENRKLCCHVRKIVPLRRALHGKDAWITGLRREQSVTRTDLKIVEWDAANGLIKINPLLEWSEEQVWDFIKSNDIPYNKLHDQGFPSIGCQPCTRAIEKGEDLRAGRWWWEMPDSKECGLHGGK
ncbi:MAG: phosphoadenylyl-sulfate reductase [Bacteroidales bacterium]|nr:phosphoadenylyl-sulfate reductase [Bacteroidales bacterium]